MSRTQDFTNLLAPLKTARSASEAARREAYRKSQTHQKLAKNEQQSARRLDGEETSALAEAKTRASREAQFGWTDFTNQFADELGVLGGLADSLDPRSNIDQLDDAYPILLMPLRLETRFAPNAEELWLRVYPDAWAVDAFEQSLSEVEVENGRLFWVGYWAAAGDRAGELAAWRNLVANHGTGRARWIVASYRPDNEHEAPVPGTDGEKVLILEGPAPDAGEIDAITDYWTAIWRAPEDPTIAADALVALNTAIGAAASDAASANPPLNLTRDEDPVDRTGVPVRAVWIEWPTLNREDIKAAGWSEAARTDLLPERLVVILQSGDDSRSVIGNVIPSTVTLGFDPSAPDAEQIKQENGELTLPDAMAWIFDFDKAVDIGLGFRIPLSAEERQSGFDRLIVAGVALRDDEDEASGMLERLFEHHYFSDTGAAILPQGTPTNNSEDESGYSREDDVEASFDRLFGDLPDLTEADPLDKLDGQWLAEWLGLDAPRLAALPHADGRDQLEARAANRLLWPATIGYSLDTLMTGILSEDAVNDTRRFFENFVLARDCIPQIRIGDQPYGILPASAWSRHDWYDRRSLNDNNEQAVSAHREASRYVQALFGKSNYLPGLYNVIGQAYQTWTGLIPQTAHVANGTDLHQTLLDILGLAPNSLEFHRRNADKFEHVFNLLRAQGHGALFQAAYLWAGTQAGQALLRDLGWKGDGMPDVLEFIFHQGQEALNHILVDDVDLSEVTPVRAYTDAGDNYLHWLVDAGETSLEALRQQEGFANDDVPAALLYHLARHALQLSYWDVGMKMHRALPDPVLSAGELTAALKEPALLHIAEGQSQSTSRYFHLYQPAAEITGSSSLFLQDHIAAVWDFAPEAAEYRKVMDALKRLTGTPTGRLERVLIEHLDLCTYRLDAWRQGTVQMQLQFMREHLTPVSRPDREASGTSNDQTASARHGIYLGAYGFVEDLRPKPDAPVPADIPADVAEAFDAQNRPMVEDPLNLGYIHAPSLDQAQTAAVLRSTYANNADDENPGTMAVNLSSWRVRQATKVLEGLRNDQSLGEMLGYRFERDLHENFELAETDEYIYALREHFSLIANKIQETYQDLEPGQTIETIEARNVIDGEALLAHIEDTGEAIYPFGLSDMPAAPGDKGKKINTATDRLRNISDAVADLAIAESVHQAMKGKPESAAANLDVHGSGLFPPVSEFIATPREGTTLTSRTALFIDPAPPVGPAWATTDQTARGLAEPALNHWLGGLFPAPADIGLKVWNRDTDAKTDMTLDQLGGQPIDWLYDLDLESESARSALSLRVEALHRTNQSPLDPEIAITPIFDDPPTGKISLFEFAAFVSSTRRLVSNGRALKASDIALDSDSKNERTGGDPVLPRARAEDAITTLESLRDDISAFAAPLTTELQDATANAAAIRINLAARLTAFEALTERARRFALTELDPAIGMRWRRQWFRPLRKRLGDEIIDWEKRRTAFHGFIARADAVPPGAPFSDVFRPLQRAERQVTTQVTAPMPDDPATLRTSLLSKLTDFETRLTELQTVAVLVSDDADAFLTALETTQPIDGFVPENIDLTPAAAEFQRPTAEMAAGATAAVMAIETRLTATTAKLAAHDAATDAAKAVQTMEEALKALFGENFIALASFTFSPPQQAELALCNADRDHLIRHQRDDLGDIAPLDTMLASAARVRNQMAELENVMLMGEALTGTRRNLIGWQLPHAVDDHWVGAAYPADHVVVGDRLTVQSTHSVAFDPAGPQIGLLIDEWTEVIPTPDITTGVAFHFDQPGSEPPQAFLLMTPPRFEGSWKWDNLIDGITETFEAAKARAVEPDHIDQTPYSLFLPTTLATTSHHPLTIALNYAVMNSYSRMMIQEDN